MIYSTRMLILYRILLAISWSRLLTLEAMPTMNHAFSLVNIILLIIYDPIISCCCI